MAGEPKAGVPLNEFGLIRVVAYPNDDGLFLCENITALKDLANLWCVGIDPLPVTHDRPSAHHHTMPFSGRG
jgi:hypothetical protein